jgi:uncharacterized protein YjbI with pentapeptide repeats
MIKSGKEYQNQSFVNLKKSRSSLIGTEFNGVTFSKSDFNEAVIKKCIFEGCKFVNCNLSSVKFIDSRISECKFMECKMMGIDWSLLNASMGLEMDMKDCVLNYSDFYKVDISNSKIVRCEVKECRFEESKAENVIFRKSDFLGSTFKSMYMKKADFTKAKNYLFDIRENRCKGGKFDYPEVLNLLKPFGISIEE